MIRAVAPQITALSRRAAQKETQRRGITGALTAVPNKVRVLIVCLTWLN